MATLTSKITETITLDSGAMDSVNTLSISGINDVLKRVVTCPTGVDSTVAMFQAAENTSDGAMAVADVKYIRVTNLDTANPINLSLQVAGGEDGSPNMSASHLLTAGQSFILHTIHDGIAVKDDAATIVTSLTDLESILIDPGSNAVKVEVFIASV